MARNQSYQAGHARRTKNDRPAPADDVSAIRARVRERMTELRILDPNLARQLVRERQDRDIDYYDEVWEGVYIVPGLPTNPHQDLVMALSAIFFQVLKGRGRVQPGANVSDRRSGWETSFRCPD